MQTITLVTGNKGKLAEWRRLFPAEFALETVDLDLPEIQSLDLEAIIVDKVKRAYAELKRPVIVEDVSAGLDNLGGLPGPFIKFFEKRLGFDALFQLATAEGDPATVHCSVAYYDGEKLLTATGKVHGSVVPTRGEHGFGFDKNFVPAGQPHTYGEMSPAEKDSLSHRAQAIRTLLPQLSVQSV